MSMLGQTWGEKPVKQWLGFYKAIVANSADPLQKLRVQMQVPQVLGTALTAWAPPLFPVGLLGPPTGSVVACVFLGGDPDQPAYITQSGIDWTIQALNIGDSTAEMGTLSVFGTNSAFPAATIAGGLSVDTIAGGTFDGSVSAYQPGTSTPEVWHTPTLSNGWTSGASSSEAVPGYKLLASNSVMLRGRFSPGTMANGTTVFTLPSAYVPKFGISVPFMKVAGSTGATSNDSRVYVSGQTDTSPGAVQVENIGTTATSFDLNGTVALD